MQKIKVLLADDHPMIRAGIRALLDAEPDMQVICEVSNGIDAVRMALELNPDVVVMDMTMPGADGLEATRRIKAKRSKLRILILTIHEERRYLHQLLRAGASGYFVKHAEPAELVTAIRAVAQGEFAIHEPMLKYLAADPANAEASNARYDSLTKRERQVLDLLVGGHTNKEIAEQLYLSIKTVETHKANIFTKLDVKTRAELIKFAAQDNKSTGDK